MKRKKWTEEEEAALIREYSALAGSGALARLRTRERKFQPIADRVNALHHLRDPLAFPFRWSWRDVSIKIQNMRHQYLGVKQKILLPPSSSVAAGFDWDSGEHHWPNFLRYKQVFGDIDLDSSFLSSSSAAAAKDHHPDDLEGDGEGGDEERGREGFIGDPVGDGGANPEETGIGSGSGFGMGGEGNLGITAARTVLELGEAAARYEERRERKRGREEEEEEETRAQRRKERELRREMEEETMEDRWWRWAEEERDRWRRREERREEEEMEWRERVVGMQMEHEKQMMQMHVDACQVQMQMIGIMVRLVCQYLGPVGGADGGLGGLPHQVLHNLQQQQQQEQGSMGGDNGKSDTSSAGHYT